MKRNRKNGPLFIAPRDEHGNKKIWDENKEEYVINKALYVSPLTIAPIDNLGHKMVWNEDRLVYESKSTGEIYSVVTMNFVIQKAINEAERFMEDEALDIDTDEDDYMLEEYEFIQQEEDRIREEIEENERLAQEEEELEEALRKQQEEQELLDIYYLKSIEEQQRIIDEEYHNFHQAYYEDWV